MTLNIVSLQARSIKGPAPHPPLFLAATNFLNLHIKNLIFTKLAPTSTFWGVCKKLRLTPPVREKKKTGKRTVSPYTCIYLIHKY